MDPARIVSMLLPIASASGLAPRNTCGVRRSRVPLGRLATTTTTSAGVHVARRDHFRAVVVGVLRKRIRRIGGTVRGRVASDVFHPLLWAVSAARLPAIAARRQHAVVIIAPPANSYSMMRHKMLRRKILRLVHGVAAFQPLAGHADTTARVTFATPRPVSPTVTATHHVHIACWVGVARHEPPATPDRTRAACRSWSLQLSRVCLLCWLLLRIASVHHIRFDPLLLFSTRSCFRELTSATPEMTGQVSLGPLLSRSALSFLLSRCLPLLFWFAALRLLKKGATYQKINLALGREISHKLTKGPVWGLWGSRVLSSASLLTHSTL